MIQFFALSVIQAINARLPMGTEVFLKPDVDAQNAIVFQHEHGIIYWSLGVDLTTNQYVKHEIFLDTDYNHEFDNIENYDTISTVIENILKQIAALK